jgi:hypothetical protein
MSGKPGRSGRPKFTATEEQRNTVKIMAGIGIRRENICLAVINPSTKKPIGVHVLDREFKTELATARAQLHALVGNFIVQSILGTADGGKFVKNDGARTTLAIFFAKTQMGWKEHVVNEMAGKDGEPIEVAAQARLRLDYELDLIAERLAGGEAGVC